jgi:hypothetical protein
MGTVDDDLLQRLITAASVTIQSWCNRSFALQDWIEIRDGLGGSQLARFSFAAWPVTAVALVTAAGVTIPPVPVFPVAPPGMSIPAFFTAAAGYTFTPTQLLIQGYYVPRWPQSVFMRYTAGYDPIPDDLQQACIDMVALKYRERSRIGQRSQAIPAGGSVAYQGPMISRKDITSDIQWVLERYEAKAPITGFLQQAPAPTNPAVIVGAA